MEIFNLAALADDHRASREREARFERLRRRRRAAEPTVRPAAKSCTGKVEHASRPSAA